MFVFWSIYIPHFQFLGSKYEICWFETFISIFQGPKFVSDEEIERIKAKIEEDNKAIAALDIKNERQKYGEAFFYQNVKS